MHISIQNLYVLTEPGIPGTLLQAAEPAPPTAACAASNAGHINPPAIGQPWPGLSGVYAGLSRGEEDQPDAHLVLLDAMPLPDRDLDWPAAVKWAQDLGDGARLPTRFESALLYANVRDKLDTGRFHWTGTQYSERYAWYQIFGYGNQGDGDKSYEGRARAVRRLTA